MSTVNEKMTALADEVRVLSGTTTTKSIDAMTTDVNAANTEITEQADLIAQITTALEGKASNSGGIILPELSNPADESHILSGKEAINGYGNKITGTIPSKSATTYTPSTTDQTIASGTYLSGTQTIKGDSRLLAENIKSGISIFGINGTYDGNGGSGGANVETCTVTVTGAENLFMVGTIINELGEIVGLDYYLSSSDDMTNYDFVKGSFIVFMDEHWGVIPNGVTTEGAEDLGMHMQYGVAVFKLISDAATFTFIS